MNTTVLRDLTNIGLEGNTGLQQYNFIPSAVRGLILVPKAWRANTAYLNDMINQLQADTLKAVGSRIYPVFRIANIEDKSTEDKMIVLGLGDEVNGPKGKYSFIYELLGGGVDLHKELAKFEGSGYNVLLVDDNDVVIGTLTENADEMAGCHINFAVQKPKWTTGADNTKFLIQVTFSNTKELFQNLAIYKSSVSIEQNVVGCLNVTATSLHAASTTKMYIGLTTNQGKIDLVEQFGSSITKAGAIILKNADGSVNTPSGVAAGATYGGLEITGTFATGTNMTFELQTLVALAALSPAVGGNSDNGLESNVLTVAIP